jgi:hypothetical protein
MHSPRQHPLRLVGFFMLLMMAVGWSVHGLAQPSAAELLDAATTVAAQADDEQPAECSSAPRELPQGEVSEAEAEAEGEPVAPELPRIIRPVFGCTARVTSTEQVPHVATEAYTVRFAASPVLARAPPRAAC